MHPAQHTANVNVENVNALIDRNVQLRRRLEELEADITTLRRDNADLERGNQHLQARIAEVLMQQAARARPVNIPQPPNAPQFNNFQPGTPHLPQNARRGRPNAEPEPQVQRGVAQEPKKPLNAYFLWLGANRVRTGRGMNEDAKLAGDMWNALPEREKQPWEQAARAERARYDAEMRLFQAN
ncbi:structure-specific recognition protein 1 [Aphelenchoides avenae]|nr:structure-specific recognition protein 1 [Aphelenchus avenae]